MDIVDAIILGIIQGLTEFLPVSSSGHLEIGREVLNADLLATENLLFTIILHFATALSTIIIFKEDIMELLKGTISNSFNSNHKYLLKIVVSMIPAVLIGLFFEKEIELFFTGNISLVGSMLIITGILLLLTKMSKEIKGDKIIEIHLRSGNDICKGNNIGDELYPIWEGDDYADMQHLEFVPNLDDDEDYSADGNLKDIRLGYYKKINTQ